MRLFSNTNRRRWTTLLIVNAALWIAVFLVVSGDENGRWFPVSIVVVNLTTFGLWCFLAIVEEDRRMAATLLGAGLTGYLANWCSIYHWLSVHDHAAFSEELRLVDSAYFTITTFATTGFGDISPRSQAARIAVTSNIGCNFLVLAVAVTLALAKMGSR